MRDTEYSPPLQFYPEMFESDNGWVYFEGVNFEQVYQYFERVPIVLTYLRQVKYCKIF